MVILVLNWSHGEENHNFARSASLDRTGGSDGDGAHSSSTQCLEEADHLSEADPTQSRPPNGKAGSFTMVPLLSDWKVAPLDLMRLRFAVRERRRPVDQHKWGTAAA